MIRKVFAEIKGKISLSEPGFSQKGQRLAGFRFAQVPKLSGSKRNSIPMEDKESYTIATSHWPLAPWENPRRTKHG